MSKSNTPLLIGLTAAGGIGYYLYNAGGDAKVAQKQAEADAHSASAKIKSELPGRGKEAQKDAEAMGSQLGKTQAEISKRAADAESYARGTKDAAMRRVEDIDRKVETEAAKAKSGLSSWWGGSSK